MRKKELLFNGEAIGGGGVTSWNDLQDKPFYTEGGGMVEILPETQAIYDESEPDALFIPQNPAMIVGETYTVVWNGVSYNVTPIDGSSLGGDAGTIGFGNIGLMTGAGDTGEPFAIVMYPEQGMMIVPIYGETDVKIAIYQNGEIVHKLDNKYLDLDWLPIITYGKGETLFEEATVTTSSSVMDGFDGAISLGISIDMSKEQICVTIDGKDYICDVMAEAGGYVIPVGSTFETALFMIYGTNLFHRNAGTYTIKITDYVTNYNKLPEGFLPSGSKTKYYFSLERVKTNLTTGVLTDISKTSDGGPLGSSELWKSWHKGGVILVDTDYGGEYMVASIKTNEVIIMAEINDEIVPVKLGCNLD